MDDLKRQRFGLEGKALRRRPHLQCPDLSRMDRTGRFEHQFGAMARRTSLNQLLKIAARQLRDKHGKGLVQAQPVMLRAKSDAAQFRRVLNLKQVVRNVQLPL